MFGDLFQRHQAAHPRVQRPLVRRLRVPGRVAGISRLQPGRVPRGWAVAALELLGPVHQDVWRGHTKEAAHLHGALFWGEGVPRGPRGGAVLQREEVPRWVTVPLKHLQLASHSSASPAFCPSFLQSILSFIHPSFYISIHSLCTTIYYRLL